MTVSIHIDHQPIRGFRPGRRLVDAEPVGRKKVRIVSPDSRTAIITRKLFEHIVVGQAR